MSDHRGEALHDTGAASAARRKGAVAAAGHTGDALAARAGLEDDDPGVRAAAIGALVRLGTVALEDLSRGLDDPSPVVRKRTAELAWRSRCDRAEISVMLEGHLDDAPEVVEAACYCLGELSGTGSVKALAQVATAHSDPLCRESAVAALGAIGGTAALPVILTALEDRPPVRRRAVLALASYEGPEVDRALARALEDRDWQVRQAAEDLTGSRGSS
ncbi:MAG: HEAT repeat domain-containing protein [Acidimicrobiales bacterium]